MQLQEMQYERDKQEIEDLHQAEVLALLSSTDNAVSQEQITKKVRVGSPQEP